MKLFLKLLSAAMLFLRFVQSGNAFLRLRKAFLMSATLLSLSPNSNAQNYSLPFDLFFAGVDSEINATGDDQFILVNARDIQQGYKFGLTNSIRNDSDWENVDNNIHYINFEYISPVGIDQGTAISLEILTSGVKINVDNKDVSDAFTISYSDNFSRNFLNSTKWMMSVYSGEMLGGNGKEILLGSTLDVLAYGLDEVEISNISLPGSVQNKEFNLPPRSGSIASKVDIRDCDLCELLLLILFSENWLNLPGTGSHDLPTSGFDISDCIEVSCPGSLEIDKLTCNEIHAVNIPCLDIAEWEWVEIVNGQSFPLISGNTAPIENLNIDDVGLYQLNIECLNKCKYSSNLYYPDCFDDPCDFDIQISAVDCEAEINLTGCPEAQYQWYVETSSGLFMISNSNSNTITADQNGLYYAIITGCPDCDEDIEIQSSSIMMNCGESCACDVALTSDNCILDIASTDCNDYTILFEYFNIEVNNWVIVPAPTFPFDPVNIGNGLYRITYQSFSCPDISDTEYIECLVDNPIDSCFVDPLLNIDECTLTAYVEGCESPQIQWQELINGNWQDIPGETSVTFSFSEDGTYRYIASGCGCDGLDYSSIGYTTDCYEDCDCAMNIMLDANCTIQSTDVDCGFLLTIQWYYLNDSGEWIHFVQFDDLNSFVPPLNGTYKKVISTKNCGTEEEEILVNCIACEDPEITITETEDCTIKVSWTGCYSMSSAEWSYLPANSGVVNCGGTGYTTYTDFEIINESSNALEGIGYIEIQPSDDGCFNFTLSCNDACDPVSATILWEQCCSLHATIEYTEEDDEVCDYCYVNACTDELLDINVEINGSPVSLSTYTDYFTFPYCDLDAAECNLSGSCPPDAPTFTDLVNDINQWLQDFGYEGQAFEGNGQGTCKGINTPFWVQQSNVVFDNSFIFETNSNGDENYQYQDFLVDNCNGVNGEPSLYVANACESATYMWSTGETSASIVYVEGNNYSVQITCPDGCTTILNYPEGPLSISSDTNLDESSLSKIEVLGKPQNAVKIDALSNNEISIYPNPTRNHVTLEYSSERATIGSINFYQSSGLLVKTQEIRLNSGRTKTSIDLDGLIGGIYFLELKMNDKTYYKKIVVLD